MVTRPAIPPSGRLRIVLATVGTTGDVLPFVALGAGLRERGHVVTAVSWELHRSAFASAGIAFLPAGPATTADEIRSTAAAAAAMRSPMAQVATLRDFHLRGAVAHYRDLRETLAGHDLVVVHGIHSLAQAAATDAGARWASAVFDPVLLPTRSAPPAGLPNLGPANPILWAFLDRSLRGLNGPLEAALREAGSGAAEIPLFRGRSPRLHLVAVSPAIAPPATDLPATTHFTGAWRPAGEPVPDRALEAFLDAGPPPVVVTFGSMAVDDPERLGTTVGEALDRTGLRAIVQGAAPGRGPGSGRVATAGPVDHAWLFPRAAAIVHHGGAGTTHAAVAAGVPSVVVPHVGDQPYWAARLHALGVAPPPLPLPSLTATALADRIRIAASDVAMRERAVRLGAQVAAEDGVGAAIGLLEALA